MTPLFAQRQSSERAFERLYRSHVQDVYRYALMVLRNRADAEDVAQTTFMKAYRAMQRGDRPRHPRKWLITIAHNTCRTRLRDAKRRPQEVSLETQVADAAAIRTNEDIDVRGLVHALGSLSFNQRSALVMRELEGRTYAEIAEVLDLSSSAVETLLFRARRAIREQLEGPLSCGETERALSLQLDGRLPSEERGRLRAHLRECGECATLARRQRARRAALRSLGPLPLPASLTSWGGGAAVGTGIGAKAAAVVAAGVVAAGVGHEAADAVDRPTTVPQRHFVIAKSPSARVTQPVVVQRTKPVRAAKPQLVKGRKVGRPTTLEPVAPEPTEAPQTPPAAAAPASSAPPPSALPVTTPVHVPAPSLPVQLPEPPPLPPLPVQPPALPALPPLPTLP